MLAALLATPQDLPQVHRDLEERAGTFLAEKIVAVATAAGTTSRGVQQAQDAAAEPARMSGDLQTLVGGFRW